MKPLVLIPAAGFGRRVGSPEAKELFKRPDGTHLIDLGIKCAAERGWPVHVITRAEKKSLIRYLEQIPKLTLQLIGPTFDWPETLLATEPFWREWNLVFLPDMDFKPRKKILNEFAAQMDMDDVDVITANHLVEDAACWGLLWPETSIGLTVGEKVKITKITKAKIANAEITKSEITKGEQQWAWGLYAFKKSAGRRLLMAQLESCRDHRLRQLPLRAKALQLSEFCDLTRPEEPLF